MLHIKNSTNFPSSIAPFIKEAVIIRNNHEWLHIDTLLPALISGVGLTVSGTMEIDYGNGFVQAPSFGTRNVFLSGQRMRLSPGFFNISFRMHPWAIHELIKGSIRSAWSDNFVNIDDALNARDISCLKEQIGSCKTEASMVRALGDFLATQLRKHPEPDLAYALRLVHNGSKKISEIASTVRVSERELHRMFSDTIGLSPQQYIRLHRFEHIVKALKNEEGVSFTRMAFDSGYFDQAHFIRDVRDIAGLSPKKLKEKMFREKEAAFYYKGR